MPPRWSVTTPSAADIARALRALREGGVVLHPTETVYGFGCDARSAVACDRIRRMKGVAPQRPLIWLVRDLEQACAEADLSPVARRLAAAFWPGPLTLVADRGDDTVALRVSPHPTVAMLLADLDGPMTSTSANRTGESPPAAAADATWIGGAGPDVILDAGPCAGTVGSTIVDCTGARPRLLRAGDLDVARLREVEEIDTDG